MKLNLYSTLSVLSFISKSNVVYSDVYKVIDRDSLSANPSASANAKIPKINQLRVATLKYCLD